MANWATALSFFLVLLPSGLVSAQTVTSSEQLNRDFKCSNESVQNLVFPEPCEDKTETLYIQVCWERCWELEEGCRKSEI
jgi:hypothetical protein